MADYDGVLVDLKSKLAALDKERTELVNVIAGLERLASGGPRKQVVVSSRTFSGLSMPQALAKCFKIAQQPQTKRQLQDVLRSGGMRAGKSFGAHVYNTLKRLSTTDGLFRRESDGRWSLREWSPAVGEPGNSNTAATTH